VILPFPWCPYSIISGDPNSNVSLLGVDVLMVTVKVCRDVRDRRGFWITIIAIAALHVPLIMLTARDYIETFPAMLLFALR